jgi:hypothetical protein
VEGAVVAELVEVTDDGVEVAFDETLGEAETSDVFSSGFLVSSFFGSVAGEGISFCPNFAAICCCASSNVFLNCSLTIFAKP